MKVIYLLSLIMFMFWTNQSQAQNADEFANFARYAADNERLMNQKNETVLIGNSITDGWARQDEAFFAENNFVGRGIGGQTSAQLLLRFRADVINLHPENVVILIGTNDIAENTGPYSEDRTVDNIISMIDIARENGIRVYIASVVPTTIFPWRKELGDVSQIVAQLNGRLKQVAKDYDLTYIDYHSALTNAAGGMDADVAGDGVHPTAKGYEIMGRVLLEALSRN